MTDPNSAPAESTASSSDETVAQSVTNSAPESGVESTSAAAGGPINLDRIRQLRLSQQQAFDQRKPKKQARPSKPASQSEGGEASADEGTEEKRYETGKIKTPPAVAPKVEVPSRRAPLSRDLEDELNAALNGDLDLDKFLVGDDSLQIGHMLTEGQRMQATVVKLHEEYVFVSMGGPNEGVLSILQFKQPPNPGDQVDVLVRGYLSEEGIYDLTIPGAAIDAADWSEIREGEVVEATVTGSNTGGLECKVGSIRGFIPASQIAPYRVENMAEFVGQKVLCIITEANERRGNLVLSRRSVLERERVEQRAQRLAAIEVGTAVKGTVRKIMDFGAFVDIGGLDGLLHISQLSWERVKHPSEVLQEGQEIHVRVDKIDPQTGKIGLSYRSLQEHPWANIQSRFAPGSIVKGTVSRIAEFGAFVRLATGVEGLVHLSELAHYRVARVNSVVSEGQEVEVKVLSIEEDKQRISLSLKAAQTPPPSAETEDVAEEVVEEAPRKSAVAKHRGPLKGGTGSASGGDRFGLKW
ncbi:MAG: S1 RNA-binding domain-containing protein [Pirellulales bacterium]